MTCPISLTAIIALYYTSNNLTLVVDGTFQMSVDKPVAPVSRVGPGLAKFSRFRLRP